MILVTGAGGQLGQELRVALAGRPALFVTSAELDITDADACKRLVADNGITTILNAAAYTKVDKAEQEEELAFAVNAAGAMNLAVAAKETGAFVVHVSTDYVFDGTKNRPYAETDIPNPRTVYGRSKLAGEEAVMKQAPAAIVLRTGWLYSAHGANFMKTMLRLGAERSELGVVADQTGTPTHAGHLARDVALIVDKRHQNADFKNISGIFHYADDGAATWYDFAVNIMREAGLNCKVRPITTEAYPTPAVRPAYSVLDKSKVKSHFKLDINHWQDDLASCIAMIRL